MKDPVNFNGSLSEPCPVGGIKQGNTVWLVLYYTAHGHLQRQHKRDLQTELMESCSTSQILRCSLHQVRELQYADDGDLVAHTE